MCFFLFLVVLFSPTGGEAAGKWQRCFACSLWQLPISYCLSFVRPAKKKKKALLQANGQ